MDPANKNHMPSANDPNSLARYERKPKGHNVRLIDQNRLEGFISKGQWA